MADRRVGKRSMGRRGRSKVESGTCNVCSAPCSSCMHLNLGFMGSKSDESSDETGHGMVTSQCSANEDNVLRYSRAKSHNSSHNTASEGSNLVNFSHDALSENAESKEIVRSSDVSDDSVAFEISAKASAGGAGVKNKVSASASVLDQSSKYIKGHEDEILCNDRAKKSGLHYPNKKADNKGSSDSSGLASELVLDGSIKEQDSKKLDSSTILPNEAKSESLHNPLANHEVRNPPTHGNTKQKSIAESNRESGNLSDEGCTDSGQDGKKEKSGKSAQLRKAEEPNSPALSDNESDDSELVEHDVKVCDICGDAGREDLLAICSRCSDGAEHTYCMREMLDEVPEGEWLCEDCKFAEEAEKRKQEAKRKREAMANSIVQSSAKRLAEKSEAAPDAKRQAIEASTGSPKKSNPPRIAPLSRESSFKGLDKTKRKLTHQTSFSNLSSDDVEGAHSTGSQLRSPKGTLYKSNSFNTSNSKPKVKLVDDVVLPRQKAVKESSSLEIKEGLSRTISKSMSLKSTDVGSSSGNDPKVKMVPSKFYQPQEIKGSKQLKERSTGANPSASKLDQKIISRSNSSLSYANNSRDLKGLQSDGKLGSLTKQASNLTRNRLEVPYTYVGDSSPNEKCGSSEQISNQTSRKDEPPSNSGSAEGLPSHTNVISQDELPRSREFRETGEKSKETLVNRPRSNVLSGSKGLQSQKEGQAADHRPVEGNRLRAAVDAALRRKPSFGKNRGSDQPDGSVSNTDASSEKTSQSQLPVSKMIKNSMPLEGLQGCQPNLRTAADPYKQAIATNGKQFAFASSEAMFSTRSMELEVNVPSARPARDWPMVAPTVLSKPSAIPEHDYIWQGDLEVLRSRNLPESHSGIQAHLSTLASPKVLEVVNKFPVRISLNEVPRLSIWPAQFREIGAKEDHIALFFFARDIESYGKCYKPLVDNMIKKDLALKGNVDGVELLIFASNQLPQNCQRWNMLFFLWGVFRGRKESCPNPQKNTCLRPSNVLPHDTDSNVSCQPHASSKHVERNSPVRETSCNTIVASETQIRIGVVNHDDPNNKESSSEHSSTGSEVNIKHPNSSPRFMSSSTQSYPKIECPKPLEEDTVKVHDASERPVPLQATGTNCNDGEKACSAVSGDSLGKKVQPIEVQNRGVNVGIKDEQVLGGREDLASTATNSEVQFLDQENPREINPSPFQANHRKRPFLDLTGPAKENSSDANEEVPLNDRNNVLVSGEASANKKQKTDSGGENECGVSGDPISPTGKRDDESHDKRVVNKKNSETAERVVFPVDLNDGKEDIELVDNPMRLSSDRQLHGVVPNLELALGAEEAQPNFGVLPFLAGRRVIEHDNNRQKLQDPMVGQEKHQEDDAAAASLSLSLSFPFPEKEQSKRAVSGSKDDRQNVNAPLFLFRDFPEK